MMSRMRHLVLVSLVLQFSGLIAAYRPVIIMHGIFSGYKNMEKLAGFVREAHPGTEVYNVDAYNDHDSLENMWTQVEGVQAKIQPFIEKATDGVNMICYSQGGLICRGILERYSSNVKTFVSLSSPQAGQYGDTEYLKYFFPEYTKEHSYLLFYTSFGQKVSIGNYWNDPYHQDLYRKQCVFIPVLNDGSNPDYKKNFLALEQLVLIGGPDDGVISPWQSSHFAFYDENEKVVPMTSQPALVHEGLGSGNEASQATFYSEDSFGLRTLNEQGRVKVFEVPGVQHLQWHHSKQIFQKYIEPYLK